jgi:hypothetical protein
MRRSGGSLGAGAGLRGALVQLPPVEAIPPELIGGADLIGKSERVDPTLLLGPPAAVPGELDGAGLPATLDRHRPHEVRAPGAGVDAESLDRPFRVRVQQLADQADHLDARDIAHEGDRGRFCTRGECDDVGLEAIGGAGARQDLGVDWHGRNISARRAKLDRTTPSSKTKLTVQLAQPAAEAVRQW